MASAPASMAASTSASRVKPQILIQVLTKISLQTPHRRFVANSSVLRSVAQENTTRPVEKSDRQVDGLTFPQINKYSN